jgi:hypothetical protein
MGSNQRRRKLDEIKDRCSGYIDGHFQVVLTRYAATKLERMKFKIEPDPDNPDAQSLLFHYPSAFTDSDEAYVRRVVKIESGAKSALDPHETKTIVPYSAPDTDRLDLAVPNVLTIKPERTFWDKIIIPHGQRHWFQNRGELYKDGQRLSRHYYDVFRLLTSEHGNAALADLKLAESCAKHARLYPFYTPSYPIFRSTCNPPVFSLLRTASFTDDAPKDQRIISTCTERRNLASNRSRSDRVCRSTRNCRRSARSSS